jgi:thiosulfate dehydrogenase [quinone] large subunit
VAGIAMRLAAAAGVVLLVLMWSAVLPPANNVFMDDHLIYALLLIGLALVGAGNTIGFGRQWSKTPLVERFPILK